MAKNCEHTFLINHSGTGQAERVKSALVPENLKLNDFTLSEWMEFAYTFAKEVNYFSTQDTNTPLGNWENFFIEKEEITSFLSEIETGTSLTPHLTLFVCFLKLIEHSKTRFNGITKRHLDFYYKEILQIEKKAPIEDSVHLIFEVAKNISSTKINEGTLLEAGKDPDGNKLQYATDEEVVVNKIAVSSLKSIYHHIKQKPTEESALYAASQVDSIDGKGGAFKEEPQWLPFGYPEHYKPTTVLETPKLGFAIAAPTLNLQEGDRDILVKYTTEDHINTISTANLANVFEVYATGEKGWLGPFTLETTSKTGYATQVSDNNMELYLALDKSQEAILPYDKKIHGENFETTHPVLRFLLKTQQPEFNEGYKLYTQLLKKRILTTTIKVAVAGAEKVSLRNDLGDLAEDKPFHPFTTQPIERSSFYIDTPDAFSKNWKTITIRAPWLNTPSDFMDHYIAYRKTDTSKNLSPAIYQNALSNVDNLYVDSNDYFKAKLTINNNETSDVINAETSLFTSAEEGFELQLSILAETSPKIRKTGPLKLSLNQSFLHAIFPQVYALALTSKVDTLLPNEPYTPFIEKLYVDYTAEQIVDFQNPSDTTKNLDTIQLFHEHPFGQAENNLFVAPEYCQGGTLYIGLTGTVTLQQVQLLFQLIEGTENPLADSFATNEKITWSVLQGNDWEELDSNYLLGDSTGNFLKTGIVTITIPSEATTEHSLLPSGMVWLKANTQRNFDVVCRFKAIHAQVIKTTFSNNKNELSHLVDGLEAGTISKLTERNAHIKSVTQPYGTFGGSPEEGDENYYQRISERIRHRDRAINLWDYEHLILEEFKEVYKVKCLNHTKDNNFHAPGHVAIVVIPDTVNQNAFDIFQPRLSTAKRNEIQTYINGLNTMFVEAQIINPDYEEVKVTLNVQFNTGYDQNYYTKQLEEDIKRYLSPWAYKETASLHFGITFHRSKLIAYLEQLKYVDYLDSVVLRHIKTPGTTGTAKTNIIPTSAKAILVSAKEHSVTAITSKCKSTEPIN
ncbi:baseplate J/gp47 family protein [Flavivirga jejuensis]|uniref:Baseplate J/gp47 family protein n=1 Tax=Flavivirga jejuensis TaxID=870487 RepID=A0ABT8WPY0_9FLAO|nr:baseplate J/gp47 family protein [Flavivirga jejuensis]MDO5975211.1 baseplate J/gp47 family protein [Flavivirga jejuensis]